MWDLSFNTVRVRVKVDSKGRVLISKSLRNLAGIREGNEVVVSVKDDKIVIEKVCDSWRELAELLGDLSFERSL